MRLVGALIGTIFGLFFAGAGAYIAFETAIPTYLRWVETKSWSATEGDILKTGGQENSVTASYRYRVDGREYLGKRVYLADFKDNIGSYHLDMRRYLSAKRRNGQPVPIWFDPANPADSIIDPEMRWGLFALMTGFCSVFIILGLWVAIASLTGKSQGRRKSNLRLTEMRRAWSQAQAKDRFSGGFIDYVKSGLYQRSTTGKQSDPSLEPWLENPRWRNGRIRSNAKRGMLGMWLFALLWNAVSAPILFVLGDELERNNYAALLGLLFPLAGIYLIKKAWSLTREWRRFGIIELELDPFPGAIGGHVGGQALIKDSYQNGSQYSVELACVYSYESGSGKSRSRGENVLWSEKGIAHTTIATSSSGPATHLSFRFDVPDDLPESDVQQSGDYHLWRIRLKAELPGATLNRDYLIPVFRTDDLASSIPHDMSRQAAATRAKKAESARMALRAGRLDQTALARSVRYSNRRGITSFYYPMFRNKALTLIAFIFAAGFGFASYSMLGQFGASALGILVTIFALPFLLVSLLATVATIYLPLNNLRVEIGNGTLQVTRRLFIVPIRRHRLATYDLTRLEVEKTGSTGQGSDKRVHFKISAHTQDKTKITIAEDVDGEDLANAFKEFLEERMGVN